MPTYALGCHGAAQNPPLIPTALDKRPALPREGSRKLARKWVCKQESARCGI
jgi:hypothetical protein